jgi:hypothetical protein
MGMRQCGMKGMAGPMPCGEDSERRRSAHQGIEVKNWRADS